MWRQMIALFQYSAILMTCKTLLKSKPTLSDFHKMIVTVIKTFFEKLQPRAVNYRDYKYFENDKFRTDLLSKFGKANIEEKENRLNNLLNACKRIFDIHAPCRSTQGEIIYLLRIRLCLRK